MKIYPAAFVVLVLLSGQILAQSRGLPSNPAPTAEESAEDETAPQADESAAVSEESVAGPEDIPIPAPEGFRSVQLGMGISAVKDKLKADPNFNYRGDPDVTMLNSPNESLIETTGLTFVERAFFQFHEDKLYTIILMLNPKEMDHFTMYTTLVGRYGDPSSLSPTEIVWDFEDIRLSLERPLAVKYIDKLVFASRLRDNDKAESLNELSRERFLDQF